jgi:3-deoxy-7-phosphoheptulonate synthase
VVIVLEKSITDKQYENIVKHLEDFGFAVHKSTGVEQIVLGAIGVKQNFDTRKVKILEGVAEVFRITEPYKLAGRSFRKEDTIININNVAIGGNEVVVMAGPCSIESEEQIFTIARMVAESGAKILRGGAFKPRTSPYSFQGMGVEGLKLMRRAADEFNLLVITEVLERTQIPMIEEYTDIFQVGARNMQNFPLLTELGKVSKPVMLKRGLAATIEDWLMSAEYILSNGNRNVMLCERGIRTFETYTRNTFDISAIPVVHNKSHLPVIADPSHAIGIRDKVIPMARAAVAAGADGLMIEVHHDPEQALSDGPQALLPEQFADLMNQVKAIAEVIGRQLNPVTVVVQFLPSRAGGNALPGGGSGTFFMECPPGRGEMPSGQALPRVRCAGHYFSWLSPAVGRDRASLEKVTKVISRSRKCGMSLCSTGFFCFALFHCEKINSLRSNIFFRFLRFAQKSFISLRSLFTACKKRRGGF